MLRELTSQRNNGVKQGKSIEKVHGSGWNDPEPQNWNHACGRSHARNRSFQCACEKNPPM